MLLATRFLLLLLFNQLPPSFSRFNKDKLLNSYLENDTLVKVKAGIILPTEDAHISTAISPPPIKNSKRVDVFTLPSGYANPDRPRNPVPPPTQITDGQFTCEICYSDYDLSDGIALTCGHYFCKECYLNHITASVSSGPASVRTPCPMPDCPLFIPASIIEQAGGIFLSRVIINFFVSLLP